MINEDEDEDRVTRCTDTNSLTGTMGWVAIAFEYDIFNRAEAAFLERLVFRMAKPIRWYTL